MQKQEEYFEIYISDSSDYLVTSGLTPNVTAERSGYLHLGFCYYEGMEVLLSYHLYVPCLQLESLMINTIFYKEKHTAHLAFCRIVDYSLQPDSDI